MQNRALICLVIVVILIALSLGIDRGPRPKTLRAEMAGPGGEEISFVHHMVPVTVAGDSVTISIEKLEVPRRLDEARVFYRSSAQDAYRSNSLHFFGGQGRFEARIPGLSRGEKYEYYVLVADLRGTRLSLPAEAAAGGAPLTVEFQGRVPGVYRFLHALLVYGTLYLLVLASFIAFDVWLHGRRPEDCFPPMLAGIAALIIGGFPFAWMAARARTGSWWESSHTLPIGIVLAYWIILLVLVKDRLLGRQEPKDLIDPRVFAGLVIVGTIITFILYVIPHRI